MGTLYPPLDNDLPRQLPQDYPLYSGVSTNRVFLMSPTEFLPRHSSARARPAHYASPPFTPAMDRPPFLFKVMR
jgi:hypothetical protein